MEFEDNATQDAITTRSEASQGPHETAQRARPSKYIFTKRDENYYYICTYLSKDELF